MSPTNSTNFDIWRSIIILLAAQPYNYYPQSKSQPEICCRLRWSLRYKWPWQCSWSSPSIKAYSCLICLFMTLYGICKLTEVYLYINLSIFVHIFEYICLRIWVYLSNKWVYLSSNMSIFVILFEYICQNI